MQQRARAEEAVLVLCQVDGRGDQENCEVARDGWMQSLASHGAWEDVSDSDPGDTWRAESTGVAQEARLRWAELTAPAYAGGLGRA